VGPTLMEAAEFRLEACADPCPVLRAPECLLFTIAKPDWGGAVLVRSGMAEGDADPSEPSSAFCRRPVRRSLGTRLGVGDKPPGCPRIGNWRKGEKARLRFLAPATALRRSGYIAATRQV
jgi:hypothetical protein